MSTSVGERRNTGTSRIVVAVALAGTLIAVLAIAWRLRAARANAAGSPGASPSASLDESRAETDELRARVRALELQMSTARASSTATAPAAPAPEAVAPGATPAVADTPGVAARREQAEVGAFRGLLATFERERVDPSWAPAAERSVAAETEDLAGVAVKAECHQTMCRLDVSYATPESERDFRVRSMSMTLLSGTGFIKHHIKDEQGRTLRSEVVVARHGHDLPPLDIPQDPSPNP